MQQLLSSYTWVALAEGREGGGGGAGAAAGAGTPAREQAAAPASASRRAACLHFTCSPTTQLARLQRRGAGRDAAKVSCAAAFERFRAHEAARHATSLAFVPHTVIDTDGEADGCVQRMLALVAAAMTQP